MSLGEESTRALPHPPGEREARLRDGVVDLFDIAGFVALIVNGEYQAEGDINMDGVVDLFDIALFVKLLIGG